ncbi:MAG: hypothetical protein JKY95_15375 [Planctomycetaceae bacterium]|nr:hypothetical protein [Planctomycetaceae bacterium]
MTMLVEVHCEKSTESVEVLVERSIRSQTGGLIRSLKIEAVDRYLIISGLTDLYYHKQLATRAAMEANGEVILLNQIKVCPH